MQVKAWFYQFYDMNQYHMPIDNINNLLEARNSSYIHKISFYLINDKRQYHNSNQIIVPRWHA